MTHGLKHLILEIIMRKMHICLWQTYYTLVLLSLLRLLALLSMWKLIFASSQFILEVWLEHLRRLIMVFLSLIAWLRMFLRIKTNCSCLARLIMTLGFLTLSFCLTLVSARFLFGCLSWFCEVLLEYLLTTLHLCRFIST